MSTRLNHLVGRVLVVSVMLVVGSFSRAAPATDESTGSGEDSDGFVWLDDLDKARLLAEVRSQPLLIVFRCEP